MRIVVASNPFKGSLSLRRVGDCVERGFRDALGHSTVVIHAPIADGGDGTLDAVAAGVPATRVRIKAMGPLGKPMRAEYLSLDGEPTAVVEMARVSGLALLKNEERDPMVATTLGTGELMRDAVARGAKRVVAGIGGSATNDGGTGAARAFGWRFLDAKGADLPLGGGALRRLARIVPPEKNPEPGVRFTVACDVTNPLLGPMGASAVYGPQKGATPAMVRELEAGLKKLADIAARDLGRDLRDKPGSGAAGGLGFGLMTFLGARMESGIGLLMKIARLDEKIRGADLVVTGEGFMDAQSAHGKAPFGVMRLAKRRRVPVIAFCGGVTGEDELYKSGFSAVVPIVPHAMSVEEAMERGEELLYRAAFRTARLMAIRTAKR